MAWTNTGGVALVKQALYNVFPWWWSSCCIPRDLGVEAGVLEVLCFLGL